MAITLTQLQLEWCIDDEHQFKTAKRLVTQLFWNGFSAITSLFFVVDRKNSIFVISEFLYVYKFSFFCDGYVTTFWHLSGAYICQMPGGHRLSRLARGTPSESRLFIGTMVWGKTVSCRLCAGQSKGTVKTRKCCFGSGSAYAIKFRNFSR